MRIWWLKRLLWWSLPLLLVGGAVSYYLYTQSNQFHTNIPVMDVKHGDLRQQVTIAGTIVPKRQTVITAPYNGYVKKLYVHLGQKVKAGDPLVSVVQSLQSTQTVYPIRAPYAGVVVQIQKREGEFVKASDTQDFILRIDDVSALYVAADVPEMDIGKLKLGQNGIIKAPALLQKVFHGVVDEIALSANQQRTAYGGRSQILYPVRIAVCNSQTTPLKPGMSALVDVTTAEHEHTLILRHEFIHQQADQRYVVTLEGEKKPVVIGLQNAQMVEIIRGIQAGETVQQVDFFNLQTQANRGAKPGRGKRS